MALYEKYVSKSSFENLADFQENFKVIVPENFNFAYDVMDELARTKPDKRALLWVGDDGSEQSFTFAELKVHSDKVANFFKAQGIGKGDMVMLVLKRHVQFWFSVIALHKLGAVVIPATNLLTTKDFVYRCNAADVKMVVCTGDGDVTVSVDEAQPQCKALVRKAVVSSEKAKNGWLDFDAETAAASEVLQRPTGEQATKNQDMMLLYFTSGTTGYPKMVWHDFTYPLGHIVTARFWHDVREDGIHFTVSDTGWGKAAWGKLYGQWLCETCVFVYDFNKFDAADILSKIEKYSIATFCAPPTMYRYMIKADLNKYNLSSLKHCSIAGEPLNPEVYNQWLTQTGLKMHEGFGQTETTLVAATYPFMEPRPGSMGLPSPGYDVVVVNENDEAVSAGETGEICIRTDKGKPFGLYSGYYRDDELTKKVWHDGLYHTGDTAWKDEEGYLWYVGRSDDIIKSSGYRIGPFEVESALLEHPAVLETAVTAIPDEDRGAIVKATVVLAKGYVPSKELIKELQEHVKHVTAPYKYPRIVEFVESLPKTISGKIRRVEIRAGDTGKKA